MDAPADPSELHQFIASARNATLATVGPGGRPRLVPICFVVDEGSRTGGPLTLFTAIDEKPKRSADPMSLGRVRDILARPTATVLVDRWDEEWSRLAWARLDCAAEILPADGGVRDARTVPDNAPAQPDNVRGRTIAALRAKYPQYEGHDLEQRPLIRLTCSVAASWGAIEEET